MSFLRKQEPRETSLSLKHKAHGAGGGSVVIAERLETDEAIYAVASMDCFTRRGGFAMTVFVSAVMLEKAGIPIGIAKARSFL